jgi:hypothetical protein
MDISQLFALVCISSQTKKIFHKFLFNKEKDEDNFPSNYNNYLTEDVLIEYRLGQIQFKGN